MDKAKIIVLLLCSLIIAAGIIIGSAVSATTLAERPLTGSFSGSLSSSGYDFNITTTDGLMNYLGIFANNASPDYETERNDLLKELEDNIISGKWPDFPYVSINGQLYFSKDAVDEWFSEKGKTRLVID